MEDKKITNKKTSDIKEAFSYCYEDKFEMEDVENRRLYINTEIDEGIIDGAVYHILRYNRLDKGIPVNERKPIIIYINSPGVMLLMVMDLLMRFLHL